MSKHLKWQFELEGYIRQGEPERAEKSAAWKVGIGLQAVDGLETSGSRRRSGPASTAGFSMASMTMPAKSGCTISSRKSGFCGGDTVVYAGCSSIEDTLRYDFETERAFSYRGLSMRQTVKHLAKLTSDIWQIHPFLEGNTRATAVFLIKYMQSLGFSVNNDMFAAHSWYFRNALVRANYNDLKNGVHADTRYLEQFLGNLLLEEKIEIEPLGRIAV